MKNQKIIMERTKLDDLIKEYEGNQEKLETLRAGNEKLRSEILVELANIGQTRYQSADRIVASVQDKEMIRYTDKSKVVEILNALGMKDFVTVEPDTIKLNKELKANTTLAATLNECYSAQKITALTVKPFKE